MTNELNILERPHNSGIVPPIGVPITGYDFEIRGTKALVNIAHSMINGDFEISLDGDKPYEYTDISEILCSFKASIEKSARFEYLLNLEFRFKSEFAQRSVQASVYLSTELLKRYSATPTQ